MTHDKQSRFPVIGRRLAAAASIVALSMGTLALTGCGDDDELPPMEQDAPMEEPAQDPGMEPDEPMDEGASEEPMDEGASEEPMGSQDPVQEPMEEEPMGSDEPMEEELMGDEEEEEDS